MKSGAMRGMLVIVVSLGAAVLLQAVSQTRTEEFVRYVMAHDLLTNEFAPEAREAVALVLSGTAFEGKWRLNEPIDPSQINLYIVRLPQAALPAKVERYRNNITYTGEDNAIVVDVAKVERLAYDLGFIPRSSGAGDENPYVLADRIERETHDAYRLLSVWVIGHELGHLVARHRPSHFSPRGIDVYPNYDSRALSREYEADRFVADQLTRAKGQGRIPPAQIELMAGQLIRMLEEQYRLSVSMAAQPLVGPLAFLDERHSAHLPASSHPEYFLRAGRLLSLLDHSMRAFFDSKIARLEQRVIRSSAGRGLVSVAVRSSQWVRLEGPESSIRLAPFSAWLLPGEYTMSIEGNGYLPAITSVTIKEGGRQSLTLALVPDPGIRYSAMQASAQRFVDAKVAIDAAFRYQWIEPVAQAPAWELKRAAQLAPNWSLPAFLAADLSVQAGDFQAARGDWVTGMTRLREEPDWLRSRQMQDMLELADLEAQRHAVDEDLDTLRDYVEVLWRLDRTQEAAQVLTDLGDAVQRDPELRLLAALNAWDEGKSDRAIAELTEVLEMPAASDLHVGGLSPRRWRAWFYERTERPAAAETDLIAAFREDDVQSGDELVNFYVRLNRLNDALYLALQMSGETPSDALCGLIVALLANKRDTDVTRIAAQWQLERTLRCRTALGERHLSKGEPEKARQLCMVNDMASETRADLRDAILCSARASIAARDLGDAQRKYRMALWLDPLDADVRIELARVQHAAGNKAAAEFQEWSAAYLTKEVP